jgi:hypothetical protein
LRTLASNSSISTVAVGEPETVAVPSVIVGLAQGHYHGLDVLNDVVVLSGNRKVE